MQPNKQEKYTKSLFGKAAIDAVYAGAREVANAVSVSLGPLGANVLIEKDYQTGRTSILHDGVSISLVVNPEEPFARNGARVMKEATMRQRSLVGDGTSAVCILTMAILDEALKATASGINPMTLRRGLESGSKKVIDKLQTLSAPLYQ